MLQLLLYFFSAEVESKQLAPVISDLINSSFDEGIFPDVLKTASMVPIFKYRQRDALLNYRPIATLPSLSKIYERVLFNRLTAFGFRLIG